MSEADIDLVLKTAGLARLELTRAEAHKLGPQFARILAQFEVLAKLDLHEIQAVDPSVREAERRRADSPRPSLSVDQVLGGAPERIGDHYSVPKVIGGTS